MATRNIYLNMDLTFCKDEKSVRSMRLLPFTAYLLQFGQSSLSLTRRTLTRCSGGAKKRLSFLLGLLNVSSGTGLVLSTGQRILSSSLGIIVCTLCLTGCGFAEVLQVSRELVGLGLYVRGDLTGLGLSFGGEVVCFGLGLVGELLGLGSGFGVAMRRERSAGCVGRWKGKSGR